MSLKTKKKTFCGNRYILYYVSNKTCFIHYRGRKENNIREICAERHTCTGFQ